MCLTRPRARESFLLWKKPAREVTSRRGQKDACHHIVVEGLFSFGKSHRELAGAPTRDSSEALAQI